MFVEETFFSSKLLLEWHDLEMACLVSMFMIHFCFACYFVELESAIALLSCQKAHAFLKDLTEIWPYWVSNFFSVPFSSNCMILCTPWSQPSSLALCLSSMIKTSVNSHFISNWWQQSWILPCRGLHQPWSSSWWIDWLNVGFGICKSSWQCCWAGGFCWFWNAWIGCWIWALRLMTISCCCKNFMAMFWFWSFILSCQFLLVFANNTSNHVEISAKLVFAFWWFHFDPSNCDEFGFECGIEFTYQYVEVGTYWSTILNTYLKEK